MHCRTRDLDEAIQAVGSIYCPHELHLDRSARAIDARLTASNDHGTSLVKLAYGAHVDVDAGEFPGLFLFMRCTRGEGLVSQDGVSTIWRHGNTVPVSAGLRTSFEFAASFEQISLRPDTVSLESLCARLIGQPLDEELRFELSPFRSELEHAWSGALELLASLPASLPDAARVALEEFMLTMVLTGHRHNYSDLLLRPHTGKRPERLAARAETYVRKNLHDTSLTVSQIAHAMGVSMRALQAAFQEQLRLTPTEYLRIVRLEQVRQRLLEGAALDTVTEVALAHGFIHLGRFAQHYRSHFGESPSDTLRARNRRMRR